MFKRSTRDLDVDNDMSTSEIVCPSHLDSLAALIAFKAFVKLTELPLSESAINNTMA